MQSDEFVILPQNDDNIYIGYKNIIFANVCDVYINLHLVCCENVTVHGLFDKVIFEQSKVNLYGEFKNITSKCSTITSENDDSVIRVDDKSGEKSKLNGYGLCKKSNINDPYYVNQPFADWSHATTVEQFIEENCKFINGDLHSSPYHGGPLTSDCQEIKNELIKINKHIGITYDGQGHVISNPTISNRKITTIHKDHLNDYSFFSDAERKKCLKRHSKFPTSKYITFVMEEHKSDTIQIPYLSIVAQKHKIDKIIKAINANNKNDQNTKIIYFTPGECNFEGKFNVTKCKITYNMDENLDDVPWIYFTNLCQYKKKSINKILMSNIDDEIIVDYDFITIAGDTDINKFLLDLFDVEI